MAGRGILASAVLALLSLPGAALAQTSGQASPSGGYYDLQDYPYFNEAAQPTPPAQASPGPSATSAPQPAPAQSAMSAPSLTVTQAPSATSAAARVQAQAEQQAPTQTPGQPYVYPKGDLAAAREQAKALGKSSRASAASLPTSTPLSQVPGYSATANPAQAYADDPDALIAAGGSAAGHNDAWRMVTDPGRLKVTLGAGEVGRAQDVEKDPNSYLSGQSLGAADGSCKPLPPGGSAGYYEATCNTGTKVEESAAVCRTPLVMDVTPGSTKYIYVCENWIGNPPRAGNNTGRRCFPAFTQPVANGVCRVRSRETVHYPICHQGTLGKCFEPDVADGEEITYECDSPAVARSYVVETTGQVVNERRDETMCNASTAGKTCELKSETCVDPDPTTRTVNGVQITRACWNWERTYSCVGTTQASDCGELAGNPQCVYVRDEGLDDPQVGPCQVTTKVYKCPIPTAPTTQPKQYICGDDVYCLDGQCEPVEREASTEFKDAVVGLHALGQAKEEFNPDTMTLFSGKRQTCHKPVFGLVNCCAGKASGLITTAAGAAAIAGGPAAIAALATPFLTMFMCSSQEKLLDVQDRMGMCHKLGQYCTDKVLGICTSRSTAYCCFESKLSRILQEQGRPQINKPWGSAKKETCKGFTLDEFSRLDLSKMDFTEVYAEFVDAAKLPDEIETSRQIQERIKAYYDSKAGK